MKGAHDSLLWKLLEGSPAEWIGFVCSLIAVFVLIALIVRVRAWFREREDPTACDHEMLLQFKVLHRQGDLTDEEFRSIKRRILNEQDHGPAENSQSETSGRPPS